MADIYTRGISLWSAKIGAQLRFDAVVARTYMVEGAATLNSAWSPVFNVPAMTFGGTVELTVPAGVQPTGFFRLRVP